MRRAAAAAALAALLLNGGGASALPRASAGLIAFERQTCTYDDGDETCYTSIWSVKADGGRPRLLAGKPLRDEAADPAWSPRGDRIAYVRDFEELWSMKADGSGKKRLTRGLGLLAAPAWSPNGRSIAFGADTGLGLWVINADGSGRRRLAKVDAQEVAWSRNGRKIAFANFDAAYVINADGSGLARLVNDFTELGDEPWSTDNRWILVGSAPLRPLFVVQAVGSGKKRLADGSGEGTWSPSGRRIAFVQGYSQLMAMSANGSGTQRLAEGEEPAWSPDGTRVAYSEGEGDTGAIHVMNGDGTGARKLVVNGQSPVWQAPSPR
jgi:Tol biopolymer transport system component